MNNVLLVAEMIAVFSLVLVAERLLGKAGLIAWVGIASVIANIQVTKCIDVIGLSATVGNVMFASTFLATDVLSECYGKQYAKKAVYVGLFSVIVYLITSQIMLAYEPNSLDVVDSSMQNLFGLAPRVCVASVSMYFFANLLDVYIFNKLKDKMDGKHLWFRNNISTIICNCSENFFFFVIAFGGVFEFNELIVMALTSSAIETIIAVCDTPFIYIAKGLHNGKDGKTDNRNITR